LDKSDVVAMVTGLTPSTYEN